MTPSATHPFTKTPNPASPFPISTAAASWTPLPALPPQEAQAMVVDLLKNNAGCRLPCWWGIVPGETEWNTAYRFLSPFVVRIGQGDSSETIENGITHYLTNYTVYYEVPGEDGWITTLYSVNDGVITSIRAYTVGTHDLYSLHQMVSNYGQPPEIWVSARNVLQFRWNFSVVLYYPDLGIKITYISSLGTYHTEDDIVRGCFQEPSGTELWSPKQKLDFAYWVGDGFEDYKPLEEAIGMSVETFFETIKAQNTEICLETPANIWPRIGQ
ncbi:MAG: hypothetical protein OEZ02_09050 [Anaerolineae bacterium]|nr:hypothetical protein [Anaerolineae bacterium]